MKRHYDPTFGYKLGFWPAVFLSIVASIQARQRATMLQTGLGKILRQASFIREPCLISRMTTRLTDPSFSLRNQYITDPYLRNTCYLGLAEMPTCHIAEHELSLFRPA